MSCFTFEREASADTVGKFDPEQRVVLEHVRGVDLNVSDVRLDSGTVLSPKCRPIQELDLSFWQWCLVVKRLCE